MKRLTAKYHEQATAIAKTMMSNRKQFTVTSEMLTAEHAHEQSMQLKMA